MTIAVCETTRPAHEPSLADSVFSTLSPIARSTLNQLFVDGPTSSYELMSVAGLEELCDANLAEHAHGWAFLTRAGVMLATSVSLHMLTRSMAKWSAKLCNASR